MIKRAILSIYNRIGLLIMIEGLTIAAGLPSPLDNLGHIVLFIGETTVTAQVDLGRTGRVSEPHLARADNVRLGQDNATRS